VATSNDFPLPNYTEVNYNHHFSYGHDVLPISGRNLHCSLFAVENSLKHRADLPDWNHVDFLNVVKVSCKEFGLGNTQNFSVDQLSLILQLKGRKEGVKLRLGYIVNDQPYLSMIEDDVSSTVLWVHLDTW
jgi:hypothetical protein